jgi:hypothetical protein
VAEKVPSFKFSDVFWLFAVAATMATSGIWEWLSPRPEIGQVAVLWVPSAVALVAIVRNWSRWLFCGLVVVIFMVVGGYRSFSENAVITTFSLLGADLIEIFTIGFCLTRWAGPKFYFNSSLSVAIYAAALVGACFLTSLIAAGVSQIENVAMPIVPSAPLQVGVAWFTSNLATYFLVASPLLAFTTRDAKATWEGLRQTPLAAFLAAIFVAVLTFVGYFVPQWLAARTGLALGGSGLTLIALPLATYLAIRRGTSVAALVGAAIGIPVIYATIGGIGPYGTGDIRDNIFDMQATLIVTMFTLLLVGAMAEQLRERTRALERSLEDAMKLRSGTEL